MSMICTCKIWQEEAQGTEQDLDRPPGLSEAAGPSTTREEIYIVIELQAMRDRDPRNPQNPHSCLSLRLMTNLDLMDQEVLLEHRPCQGLPRVRDRHQGHLAVQVDLKMWHWLDVMFHTSLI